MAIFLIAMVFGIVMVGIAIIIFVGGMIALFRGISRFIFLSPNGLRGKNDVAPRRRVVCQRTQCMTENPAHARFCRNCGEQLKAGQVRRVA